MRRHRLDLDIALPHDAASCDACVERLLRAVQGIEGVTKAHVDRNDAARPKLCLHYDPTAVRIDDIEARVRSAGAELRTRYEHLVVPVAGLRHERQAGLAEAVLARAPGVLHASAAFGSQRLYVEFDPSRTTREAVLAAIGDAGLASVSEHPGQVGAKVRPEADHAHGGPFGERTELVFSLACGAATAVGWGLARAGFEGVASTACFVIAYALGSWFTLGEVALALRARRFEIDFLMLLAAAGAAILGEWFEGALLLFLFTLGHGLEGFAMRRARHAIEGLAKLAPETAVQLDATGQEREVRVEALAAGDRILVRPNTRIAADGIVIAGTSSVDQAPITGESVPVDKRPVPDSTAAMRDVATLAPEHRVFAGTINGPSALTIVVTRKSGDSTLARVVQMVADAETQKSPTQLFTDRFERAFVPIVVVGVLALLLFSALSGEPFAQGFYRAMAVLVAASPCALAIATPSAVLAGVARAARVGVLVKGGAHLESLGAVRAIAFDKTGTLTEGKPTLTDVVPLGGASPDELLSVAVAVERQSDHPLASAVVDGAASWSANPLSVVEARDVEAVVGFGVRARVGEARVAIGKAGLFTADGPLPGEVEAAVGKLQVSGRTVMVVRADDRFLGVLGVMDTPRESARPVVAALHALGVERTIMLSGDNQRVADAVARAVGIREARGDLLPEQKVAAIAELARSTTRVAMVGDGVNDAPAMANATVGIAMGAGGSDVALETADIALMGDDLRALSFAVGLSRAARRIIRQNLWVSLGMVGVLIPATIAGVAEIGVAVAMHEGSTLVVVANALRLLSYVDATRGGVMRVGAAADGSP